MSSDLQSTVHAILAVHHSSNQQEQSRAINWLAQFTDHDSSWSIWRKLLQHDNIQIRFFAANAIAQKVRSQWYTLSSSSQQELKEDLQIQSILNSENRAFHIRLCMALAAIAVRSFDGIWSTFWQDCIDTFEGGFATPTALVNHHSPHQQTSGLVWLLRSRLTIMYILYNIPTEFEQYVCSKEAFASTHHHLISGNSTLLQFAQCCLEPIPLSNSSSNSHHNVSTDHHILSSPSHLSAPKVVISTEMSPTHSLVRSGSAPSHRVGKSSLIASTGSTGSTPIKARPITNDPELDYNLVHTATQLKLSTLLALQAWISSQGITITLQSIMSSHPALLYSLFETMKVPSLTTYGLDVLLPILTRRTSSSDIYEPSLHSSLHGNISSPAATSSASFSNQHSGFTSASRLTQGTLQNIDHHHVTQILQQLLTLSATYREARKLSTPSDDDSQMSSESNLSDMENTNTSNDKEKASNSKICRSIVQLFSGVGEANVQTISENLELPVVQEFLHVLLEMTSHPDLDIAELCMEFWSNLEYSICGNTEWSGIYHELIRTVLRQCMHPSSEASYLLSDEDEYERSMSTSLHNFNLMRDSAVKTLRACYSVIGDSALAHIEDLMNQACPQGVYDPSSWRILELAYFAVTSMNLHVPSDAPLISQMMLLAFSVPVDVSQHTRTFGVSSITSDPSQLTNHHIEELDEVDSLSSIQINTPPDKKPHLARASDTPSSHENSIPPLLLVTLARFFGEYRVWLLQQDNPIQLLEPCLCTCLHWSSSPNSELAFASSMAFRDLCVESKSCLVPYMRAITEKFCEKYASYRPDDRVTLTKGLVSILHHFDSKDDLTGATVYLMSPSCETLKSHLERGHSMSQQPNIDPSQFEMLNIEVTAELNTLSTIFTLNPQAQTSTNFLNRASSQSLILDCTFSSSSASSSTSATCSEPSSPNNPPFQLQTFPTSNPLIRAISETFCWDILEQTGHLWGHSNAQLVLDSLCSVYDTLISATQESFLPLLPSLLERLSNLFSRTPTPSALHTMGLVIKIFGKDQDKIFLFSRLVTDVSNSILDAISTPASDPCPCSITDPTAPFDSSLYDPDILGAYFSLVGHIIDSNPDILVSSGSSAILTAIVIASLHFVSSLDPAAIISGVSVLDKILFGRHAVERPAWKQFNTEVISHYGQTTLWTLLRACVLVSHHKASNYLTAILHKLSQSFKDDIAEQLTFILENDPGLRTVLQPDHSSFVARIFVSLRATHVFKQFMKDAGAVFNMQANIDILRRYESQIPNNEPVQHSMGSSRLFQLSSSGIL